MGNKVGQGPTVLAAGMSKFQCLDIFFLTYHIGFLSPSLGDSSVQTDCLKELLNNQPTNRDI